MMNPKKVLFLCGHYAYPSAANSICVQNLAEESIKQGYEPFVLARGCEYTDTFEVINGVKVWKCYGDAYSKVVAFFEHRKNFFFKLLFLLVQLVRYSYVLWIYPITSKRDLKNLCKRAQLIIEQNDIGVVVATYGPYEAVQAAIKMKKKVNNKLKVISYHLDLLTNPSNESQVVSKIKQHMVKKAVKKEFSIADKIFLPMTAPSLDNHKIHYVDFPLYIPNQKIENNNNNKRFFSKDTINVVIAGSLDSNNRNPHKFCEIIEKLPTIFNKRVVLHVWGKTAGIDLTCYNNVLYHGMAKVEEVPHILQQSDFLLNVGNKNSYRMIPSKIFQMFAAKKPIFFLFSSPKDRSVPYFEKYGYTCFIPEYEQDSMTKINDVVSFIELYYNKLIEVDDTLFEKSTPSYIVHKLLTPIF